MGQTILTGSVTGETFTIDVSSLPSGLYFITVGEMTQKLLMRH